MRGLVGMDGLASADCFRTCQPDGSGMALAACGKTAGMRGTRDEAEGATILLRRCVHDCVAARGVKFDVYMSIAREAYYFDFAAVDDVMYAQVAYRLQQACTVYNSDAGYGADCIPEAVY